MRLKESNLWRIQEKGVKVPCYDRSKLKRAIVHIGLGHFHRAHFLTYLDTLLSEGYTDWGVYETEVMPQGPSFRDSLHEQDYLYSVLSLDSDGKRELRVNGPIVGFSDKREEVLSLLSSPETKLITLTVTEKGYNYDEATGSLDYDAVKCDLESDEMPETVTGLLSLALMRRASLNAPVTIMSCDNAPENGVMLKRTVIDFMRQKYPEAVSWVEANAAFPSTMVDRITPGTSADDLSSLSAMYGIEDEAAVHSEAFLQWVIEDKTASSIPDFSASGALIVPDVRPYELMKIRLLNGSHSALSYPAYMLGFKKVHEAVSDPLIRSFIRDRYMEEITRTLPPVPGVDIDTYKDELIRRFSNPYIADTVLRLASDGSKKIANAILRPLEEGLEKGYEVSAITASLSLWEYFYIYKDNEGRAMPIDDPLGKELLAVSSSPRDFLITAGLRIRDDALFRTVGENIRFLEEHGVREFLKRV